jgi:transcriptional regulator with XRE-family HTH domain
MTAPHPIVQEMARRRAELGLTKRDVHAVTGISTNAAWNWENGVNDPTLRMLDAYLRAMGFKLAVVPLEGPVTPVRDEQIPFGELHIDENEKYCRGCRQVRARSQFFRDKSRADGVQSRCKFCVLERMQARQRRLCAQADESPADNRQEVA